MKNLLKNRNFKLLWTSQIMSQITINIMNFLVIVRVYEQTHSPIASSLIWVAYALPALLVGPIGSASVDMIDRRKVLMFATLSQSVVILLYVFTYDIALSISYIVVFLYSMFNQFYVPAESASLPYLVPKKDLTEGNSTFFLSQQVAVLVAFVAAGVVAELFGLRVAFIAASVLLLFAFTAVHRLPKMEVAHVGLSGNFTKKVRKFFDQVLEGFRFILTNKVIFLPFMFLLSLWTLMSILTVNMPLIGEEIIKVKSNLAGIMIVIPAAFGAFVGTTYLSKYDQKIRRSEIVRTSLLILATVFISVPLLIPLLNFWLARTIVIIAFFFAGLGYIGSLVPSLTYIQTHTPENMTGRVLGYFWFVSSIIGILPVLFSATITEVFGIRILLVTFGVVALAASIFLRFYFPKQFATTS